MDNKILDLYKLRQYSTNKNVILFLYNIKGGKKMLKKRIYIVIIIILIFAFCIGGYFLFCRNDNSIFTSISNISNNKNIKKEKVTSENYEEISNRISKELGDVNDTYYFSYACMYYIMENGFTKEYMTTQDESLLYKNIYDKTVQELINEGQQLMKDNNITIEEYKQNLNNTDI